MGNQIFTPFEADYFRSQGREWRQDSCLRRIRVLLTHHSLSYLCALRKSQAGSLFFRLIKRGLRQKYGLEIDSRNVGPGLYLGHAYNITVSDEAVIGANCNLNKGCTIGAENRGSRKGAPILGDRVWVGTNAVIVGKITIGSNVLIAPNAWVNQDIPSDSIVYGNPAQLITGRPDAVNAYIEHTV